MNVFQSDPNSDDFAKCHVSGPEIAVKMWQRDWIRLKVIPRQPYNAMPKKRLEHILQIFMRQHGENIRNISRDTSRRLTLHIHKSVQKKAPLIKSIKFIVTANSRKGAGIRFDLGRETGLHPCAILLGD